MRPFVIDTETGIKNRGEDAIGNMKASPHHPDNKIVWFGHCLESKGNMYTNKCTDSGIDSKVKFVGVKNDLWIGHNIKFDLLYLLKEHTEFREHIWPTVKIWDTMLAEYILSGQVKKYPSLDMIAPKYGGELKDDRLKDLWNNDVDTEDIDDSIIEPYLKGDLNNTMLVYEGQTKRAKELGMLKLIEMQMDGLKATTEMEHNGMQFDTRLATKTAGDLSAELGYLQTTTETAISSWFHPSYKFNIGSVKDMGILLYGGHYEIENIEQMVNSDGNPVRFKSGAKKGQLRTRKVKEKLHTEGFGIPLRPEYQTKKGKPASGEAVLEEIIAEESLLLHEVEILESVLKIRQLNKDISTYYVGYSEMVWPDGCIHPNYNHVSTDTGRLSCSNPNLQNVSSKEE